MGRTRLPRLGRGLYIVLGVFAVLGVFMLNAWSKVGGYQAAGATDMVATAHAALAAQIRQMVEGPAMLLAVIYGVRIPWADTRAGTVVHVLTRPVSRTSFIVGKLMGTLAMLTLLELVGVLAVAIYAAVMGVEIGGGYWLGCMDTFVRIARTLCVATALGLVAPPFFSGTLLVSLSFLSDSWLGLQQHDHPLLRALGTAGHYLLPAHLPGRFVPTGLQESALHPHLDLLALVWVENTLYGVVAVALGLRFFCRRDLGVGGD